MNKNKFITSPRAKKTNKNDLYTFIIVADTPGYRMKSHGASSLINIQNKKLIDIQIEAIVSNFENSEIILSCGFDVDKVYKYVRNNYSSINIRVIENQIFNNSNSCESIRIALNNTNNTRVYIIDGHLLLNQKVFSVRHEKSHIYIEQEDYCKNLEVGVNINEDNIVEHFSYGGYHKWSEIVYFSNKDYVDSFRKIITSIDYKQKFLFEALNELIKTKHSLQFVSNSSPLTKINNVKTYNCIKD